MPLPKYKKYYQLMIAQNQMLFEKFLTVHTAFVQNSADKQIAQEFHSLGTEILDIIRFWERKLCAGMERGYNGQYSSKVAEKFWSEIKKTYSHIELVGIKSIAR